MDPGLTFNQNTYGSKAEEDYSNAQAVYSARVGTPRAAIFWCEQAIEKYFKHLLTLRDKTLGIDRRHKLLPLAKDCGYSITGLERSMLLELGRIYYERYPVPEGEEVPEDPTWDDVKSAIGLVKGIRSWVLTQCSNDIEQTQAGLRSMKDFLKGSN